MNSLGIDVDASDSDNMKTFKKMTVDTGVFTYDELVVWFETLSKLSNCRGMAACAKAYAQRLVEEDGLDEGRYWLKTKEEYWLSFMKRSHYYDMMEFGFEREVQLPLLATPVEPNPVRPLAVGASASYGYTYPPTPQAVTGVKAALEGFAMRRPPQQNATHAANVGPQSVLTAATMGSEIADALVVGMSTFTNTFTEQMKESAKSQQVLSENHMLDKPVHGIIELQPEMGYKLTVNAFLTWLKSVEEAWGKVSAGVTQVLAKLRSNLLTCRRDRSSKDAFRQNERKAIY